MEIDDPKETKILIKTKARKFKGKDAKDTNDIYINSLISREVEMPIINIGALYLTSRLSKDLQPKPITKLILWLTLILQVSMAMLILFSQMIGFS